MLPHMLVS